MWDALQRYIDGPEAAELLVAQVGCVCCGGRVVWVCYPHKRSVTCLVHPTVRPISMRTVCVACSCPQAVYDIDTGLVDFIGLITGATPVAAAPSAWTGPSLSTTDGLLR